MFFDEASTRHIAPLRVNHEKAKTPKPQHACILYQPLPRPTNRKNDHKGSIKGPFGGSWYRSLGPKALHPQPQTLNQTLNPQPQTLNPIDPKLSTLNSKTKTPNPEGIPETWKEPEPVGTLELGQDVWGAEVVLAMEGASRVYRV